MDFVVGEQIHYLLFIIYYYYYLMLYYHPFDLVMLLLYLVLEYVL
eukprot:UN05890